jgi:hypothetical protein
MAILKKGLSGEPVRRLETKLGIEADGTFGPGTEKCAIVTYSSLPSARRLRTAPEFRKAHMNGNG